MTLQLTDQSIKCPYGVVEDVLMKVDKFTFPVDFVIHDMEENIEISLILGTPFMKTAKVIIDVNGGKLKIRDQEEEVNFRMSEGIHNLEPKDINAAKEVLSMTSKLGQVSHLLKNCSSCFSPKQLKEKKVKDPPPNKKKDILVNHHTLLEKKELKPGQPIMLRKFKWKFLYAKIKKKWPSLWVIKDIKANGRVEIKKPYSGTTKLRINQKLKPHRCEEKNHTRKTYHKP